MISIIMTWCLPKKFLHKPLLFICFIWLCHYCAAL